MPPELVMLVAFFKTLSDASRLKILGILARQPATVGELAEMLQLREPTVSHHLGKLKSLGLVAVEAQGTLRTYSLRLEVLERLSREVLEPAAWAQAAEPTTDLDAWERKVLDTFVRGDVLAQIPVPRRKREVILRWLVDRVERGRRYSERELSTLIQEVHPDSATLRRELVGAGLLVRERSVYWRPDEG